MIIFSRDEQKQFQMAQDYPSDIYPQIRFSGDVRDKERLVRAFQGVDCDTCCSHETRSFSEYNPTNV